MEEAEPGKPLLLENGLCLHAARHQRIQRFLSHRNLRQATRTKECEAKGSSLDTTQACVAVAGGVDSVSGYQGTISLQMVNCSSDVQHSPTAVLN